MTRKEKPRRAGTYAQDRYTRGLRNWRAQLRPVAAAVFGPLMFAGGAVAIIEGHRLSWLAGMAFGGSAAAWMVLRDMPPRYVEQWHDGAEGERMTENALRPLSEQGWTVVHDVQARYGNYDHIAVGPGGVLLFDSKNLQGVVEFRDGVPHLQRRLDEEATAPCDRIRPRALSAAARVSEDIQRRTGRGTWVQAVVVFWSEFPSAFLDDGRCVFVHGSKLRSWVEGRGQRLSQASIDEFATAVELLAAHPAPKGDAQGDELISAAASAPKS